MCWAVRRGSLHLLPLEMHKALVVRKPYDKLYGRPYGRPYVKPYDNYLDKPYGAL